MLCMDNVGDPEAERNGNINDMTPAMNGKKNRSILHEDIDDEQEQTACCGFLHLLSRMFKKRKAATKEEKHITAKKQEDTDNQNVEIKEHNIEGEEEDRSTATKEEEEHTDKNTRDKEEVTQGETPTEDADGENAQEEEKAEHVDAEETSVEQPSQQEVLPSAASQESCVQNTLIEGEDVEIDLGGWWTVPSSVLRAAYARDTLRKSNEKHKARHEEEKAGEELQQVVCTATPMEGLVGGVMYVPGEDLESTDGPGWTLVHGGKKRKQQQQPSVSKEKIPTEKGWRPLKLKATPRPPKKSNRRQDQGAQEACTAAPMEGLVGSVMYVPGEDLANTTKGWTVVHGRKNRPKRQQQAQTSVGKGKASTEEGSRPLKVKATPSPPHVRRVQGSHSTRRPTHQ